MQFCDYAKINVESGSGGGGCVSFRREKNIPFGGPDGGHGGHGGGVGLQATKDLVTLIDFRYRPHYKAPNGKGGQGRNKAGLGGEDLIIKVPVGTEIWVQGEQMADLIREGQKLFLLKGGMGGRGNSSFATSTNRAPRENTPGELGQRMTIELKLKVLADVGLIGLPNAGKSTLLKALTNADPKIGPYPFTTLIPQLGTFITPRFQEVVLADLPGLVEGAHEGKGLGHRFLGHGERCKHLLHVIDLSQENVIQTYHAVRKELLAYNPLFEKKPEAIVLSKKDMIDASKAEEIKAAFQGAFSLPVFVISALAEEGLSELKDFLCTQLYPTSSKTDDISF